ncbi:uncharacterized protein LOC133176390 [Saccostrea echinata]|uniref:uncharacterized protein LOC133176390 n=1 Tax=Saccostrea echinata TaxID=191078 RepID=UPI002A8351F7|nr:uncharacterized protein LOC133176390 [Saccostrea echinata]
MANIIEFTSSCFFYLNQYFRTFWPIKILFDHPLHPPSTETELKVLRAIYLLRHQDDLEAVMRIVESLPKDEDILGVFDQHTKYNLIQLAVITNNKPLVNKLVQYYSGHLNLKCNNPVHLASHLGHYGILETLLERGGRSGQIAGMCYPGPHSPLEAYKILGLLDYSSYKCQVNVDLPVFYAISSDSVNCVKLLLSQMQSERVPLPSPSRLLHFACCKGTLNCLRYFVERFPDEVNSLNSKKETPLLQAVVWGRECAKSLIDNGADVNCVSKTGETALHRLYCNDIDGLFTIFDTTKYLLTTGIEQLVNEVDNSMETPLHYLVTHVSFIGGNLLHPSQSQNHVTRLQLQPDYQDQVVQSLDLLLKFNADPLRENRFGLQPLNKLMHVALKSCGTMGKMLCDCVQFSIDSKYLYKNDFSHLNSALEVLLRHGSDPNSLCSEGHSSYQIFLQCLLENNLVELCNQAEGVVSSLCTLLKYGAKVNFQTNNGFTCSTILAKFAARHFTIPVSEDSKMLREEFSNLVCEVLRAHFMHGLNPNVLTNAKHPYLKGGMGNAIIEFVHLSKLAKCPSDFVVIRRWLTVILQWGGDPDVEPYQSEPIICHSQSSIFLRHQGTQPVSHYIHEMKDEDALYRDGYAEELLMLFYHSMSHKELCECLNSARSMTRFHPMGAVGKKLLQILSSMSESPRSLMEISRVVIYKSIDRQLAVKVPHLPIPNSMKKYLLEIQ